jgi:hypothetical protein
MFEKVLSLASWNQGSASITPALVSGPAADIYSYGMPIYTVTASTPRYNVTCTAGWGLCPLSRQPVPIPPDAAPSAGSDGAMVVVDPNSHLSYEFWQFHRGSPMTAAWGAVVSLLSAGNTDIYGGPGGTGSGLSALAGVATIAELEAGHIPHALVLSSSLTCADTFVAPAIKTDGSTGAGHCIAEGARVQLDPSINLAAIPGITPFELTVGRALQTYGAFCGDTGGASLALRFQTPTASTGNPYPSLGAVADYYTMPHIPWNTIKVVPG